MRLSFKFFSIAYLVTLFSINCFGIILTNYIYDEMWQTHYQRIYQSESYAINSFLSYTYYYPNGISNKELLNICHSIKTSLGDEIVDLEIKSTNNNQMINQGKRRFYELDHHYYLESTCFVTDYNFNYEIVFTFNFTDIKLFQTRIFYLSSILCFVISTIIGLLLYYLSKKMTRPLQELTSVVTSISKGNYGDTVDINTNDYEIKLLMNRFNKMSLDTKDAMDNLILEAEKNKKFVANFSHEMKTPMTTIIGYSDLLTNYTLTHGEQKQALQSIALESKRLDKLAKELLSLFGLSRSNRLIKMEPLSLKTLSLNLDGVCQILKTKYDVDYSIQFPEVSVWGNEVLILSLFTNLIDNAFKASNKSDMVYIYGVIKCNKIEFQIKDKGCGIEEEHIKHLFDPFYRVDQARSRKEGGNGIGLSICQEIAKVHHTSIHVYSLPQFGTTFLFELEMVGDSNV